jgi:hypothetical protein
MKSISASLIMFLSFMAAAARPQQFDLADGYNYQNSDQGGSIRTNLNGWYVSGQFRREGRAELGGMEKTEGLADHATTLSRASKSVLLSMGQF